MPQKPSLPAMDVTGGRTSYWVIPLVFALLAVLRLYPIWAFDYFPSQDGPSHLYNARIMSEFGREPIYAKYFAVRLSPAGNLSSHLWLAAIGPVTGAFMAEKLLLSGIVLSLPLLWLWFLFRLPNGKPELALVGFVLVMNLPLFMGFWNFCIGISLGFVLISVAVQRQKPWGTWSAVGLGVLSGIIYASHAMAWAVMVVSILLWWGAEFLLDPRQRTETDRSGLKERGRILRVAKYGALLWPLLLLIWYLALKEMNPPLHGIPFIERVWFLFGGGILSGGTLDSMPVVRSVYVLGLIAIGSAAILSRRRYWRGPAASDVLGLVALGTGALTLVLPDTLGSMVYATPRLALLSALFFVVWLGAQPLNKRWRLTVVIFSVAVAGMQAARQIPAIAGWQPAIREIASLEQEMAPGSVVISLQANARTNGPNNPLLHAVGYWQRNYINVKNFEAVAPHFPVRFVDGQGPNGPLGELGDAQAIPSRFRIRREDWAASGKIDTVLVTGATGGSLEEDLPKEFWDPDNLFTLRAVSMPEGRALLYRLRSTPATDAQGGSSNPEP